MNSNPELSPAEARRFSAWLKWRVETLQSNKWCGNRAVLLSCAEFVDQEETEARLDRTRSYEEKLSEVRDPTWQPFDTAPDDGTQLLVWREDAGIFVASFQETYDAQGDPIGGRWQSECQDLTGDLPPFWMPFPDEPTDRRPHVGSAS